MEDREIIELYFDRSERAIAETEQKYGKYCQYIAYHILYSTVDAEECVSDTYYRVWNSIPPQKPTRFKAFIGRITRNLAINQYHYRHAQKRSVELEEALEELRDCSQGKGFSFDEEYILKEAIDRFLEGLIKRDRIVFLQRYWYFCSIHEIAVNLGLKEGNVKVILNRVRKRFKDYLEEEGMLK